FIATNEDAVYPTPEGLVPGTGAVVKAVEVASGTRPQVIGKPARPMFDLAQESLGLPPEARIAMVGDNPLTDIAGAIQAGLAAIWVRRPVEGVHTVGLGAGDEPPLTPDYVVTRVGELLEDVPPYQPGRSQVRPARLEPWVAAIVTDAQERLLLVREAGGHRWVLPHGPLRAGEGIAEAAQRLVKEQAGCEAAVVRLGGVYADPRWNTTVSSDGRPLQLLTVAVCCRLAAPAHGMDGERSAPGGAVARLFASESLPSSLPALHARWIADAAAGGGGVIG
ncbi:MAG TPA: HAD hydrolase-like protein, partial [Bacillota bacterium]